MICTFSVHFKSASTRLDPIKPAAPVTSIFLCSSVTFFSTYPFSFYILFFIVYHFCLFNTMNCNQIFSLAYNIYEQSAGGSVYETL